MIQIEMSIQRLMNMLRHQDVDIYNEVSLQHELGFCLRHDMPPDFKVQFERAVNHFGIDRHGLVKKEIDITVFSPSRNQKHAIELKYPRNGQYPEQMFKACQDIAFLEQLVNQGFGSSYFIMLVDDHLFFEGPKRDGVFAHFRNNKPISGVVTRPTGTKQEFFRIQGKYLVTWREIADRRRYAMVQVTGRAA